MPPRRRSVRGAQPAARAGAARRFEPLLHQIRNEPSINDLHDVLKSKGEGLAVLSHYRRFGSLNHGMRDELAARCIYGELGDRLDTKLTAEKLLLLAQQIVEIFPKEKEETWWSAEEVRGKLVTDGRLKHKYYNVRRGFIKVGLISHSRLIQELEEAEELVDELDFDEDEDMLWLFNNAGPFLQLSEKWALTATQRKHLQRSISISEFVMKFPCLRQQHGWELLTVEYDSDHPTNKSPDWPLLLEFLKQELKKDKGIKILLENCVTDDETTLVLLDNFSTLFKNRTLPKSTGVQGTWRVSKGEAQNSFFLHIKRIAQLREELSLRKETLGRFRLTLQPFVVAVGDRTAEQCLVVVDDIQWLANSPLHALEICFKVFFALDGKFPPEGRHIWLFIQRCIFKLETPHDYLNDRPLKTFLACHLADFENFEANRETNHTEDV